MVMSYLCCYSNSESSGKQQDGAYFQATVPLHNCLIGWEKRAPVRAIHLSWTSKHRVSGDEAALLRFKPEEQIVRRWSDRDAVDSPGAVYRAAVINPTGSGKVAVGLDLETAGGRRPRNGYG